MGERRVVFGLRRGTGYKRFIIPSLQDQACALPMNIKGSLLMKQLKITCKSTICFCFDWDLTSLDAWLSQSLTRTSRSCRKDSVERRFSPENTQDRFENFVSKRICYHFCSFCAVFLYISLQNRLRSCSLFYGKGFYWGRFAVWCFSCFRRGKCVYDISLTGFMF